ncbi:hypothetical protein [Streptomyces huiliensis]|uniref:hypothetical protein n=1 Tax=Streptomyces huiliensis TaxID=2876027 RepID=UPI001CBC0C38|nr:hypothetical protein [Streptomyces huiliensis]MBZ4320671.1 hypothetical protein [Streptomyces huiliensis]
MSDEPFPGWVEVRFTDAVGRCWSLFDKPAIFGDGGGLGPEAAYPVAVSVACVVREAHETPEGGEVVAVSTSPHGVATPNGREDFVVRRDQLIHR